jgi:hypothetical protein
VGRTLFLGQTVSGSVNLRGAIVTTFLLRSILFASRGGRQRIRATSFGPIFPGLRENRPHRELVNQLGIRQARSSRATALQGQQPRVGLRTSPFECEKNNRNLGSAVIGLHANAVSN